MGRRQEQKAGEIAPPDDNAGHKLRVGIGYDAVIFPLGANAGNCDQQQEKKSARVNQKYKNR